METKRNKNMLVVYVCKCSMIDIDVICSNLTAVVIGVSYINKELAHELAHD